MIYLLGVVIVALRYGRWPSVVATVLNIVVFDYVFVAPTGTFAVSDVQYLFTFGVMLAVGIIIGNLTAGVRYQARIARYREQRARHLYEMSRALSSARSMDEIVSTCQRIIDITLQARSELLLPQENGDLKAVGDTHLTSVPDRAIARWSFDRALPAGAGTDTLPGVPWQMLPLKTSGATLGLLVIEPANLRQLMIPEQQRMLETFTVLLAGALERMELTRREERARLSAEREELRNSLLAALSHDLRTPLTVLFGQSEILTLDLAAEGSKYAPQASQIRQQTLSTIRLVNNMLDMARIQSGGINLRAEWIALDEVIGGALKIMEPLLNGRQVRLELPEQLLLIKADGPLLERVFTNLLENALKYAGEHAELGIRAKQQQDILAIEVWDNGPGITEGQEVSIFEKFARGNKESAVPGVGLGLAICKAIVEMHDGHIRAANRPEGGACFYIQLPLGQPPSLPDEIA